MALRKIFLTIMITFIWVGALYSQGFSVRGTVFSDNQPVPFANISLLKMGGSKLLGNGIANEQGAFEVSGSSAGSFILSISAIGYKVYVDTLENTGDSLALDVGMVELSAEVMMLNEVKVSGERPAIEVEADKVTVNLANSPLAQGSNVLDVLGRAPGVYVDGEGNIQLNGKSGILVLIDGKQTYMDGAELANYLRGQSSSNVESIELINNVSSRYDASGSGGAVNIKLKRNTLEGLFGNIQTGGQYNGKVGYNGNGSVNYKSGKWRTGVTATYDDNRTVRDIFQNRRFSSDNFEQTTVLDSRMRFFSGNAVVDYDINEFHSVGGNVQYNRTRLGNGSNSVNNIERLDGGRRTVLANTDDRNNSNRVATNIHYIGKLDSLGSQLSFDADYIYTDFDATSELTSTGNGEDIPEMITTSNPSNYKVFTVKADFNKAFSKSRSLEVGLKGSWVRSDNILDFRRMGELDGDRSFHYLYEENVSAAYANFVTGVGKKLKLTAGLRAEYTDIVGTLLSRSEENRTDYLNLFPNVLLEQRISERYKLSYGYNRRIVRPNFRLLNPNTYYIDPYTVSSGNPYLTPMFTDNYEVGQILDRKYQLVLSYSRSTDVFTQVFIQDDASRETVIQTQNLDKQENFGLRILTPLTLSKWWKQNNTILLNHVKYRSMLNGVQLDNSRTGYMVRTANTFDLPLGVKMEVVGTYVGPTVIGQMRIDRLVWLDGGLMKSLGGFTFALNATDIFRSQTSKVRMLFGNINTDWEQYNSNQSVRLTVSYRFSKGKQFSLQKRTGNKEEENRLN